jgi:DNA-binding transcriptional ArsR family regulator
MKAGVIARRFKLTRPAVSEHITVLRDAGLLAERRVGAKRLYVVKAESSANWPSMSTRSGARGCAD